MADALLAFGVYGVRKNRHRPAPTAAGGSRRAGGPVRRTNVRASGNHPVPGPAGFRPRRCGGKPSAVRCKEARPSAFRRATRLPQAAGRRQGRQFPPAQAYMRQKRFGHAAPDRENGTGRPRPSAGKRRGNSSVPLRGGACAFCAAVASALSPLRQRAFFRAASLSRRRACAAGPVHRRRQALPPSLSVLSTNVEKCKA